MRYSAAAFLLFALAATVKAQPFDAVVAGHDGGCVPILPAFSPQLEGLGEEPEVVNEGVFAVAPAPQGRIYGLTDDRIVRVRRDSITPFATIPSTHIATGLVADAQGSIYVLASIPGGDRAIDAFQPDGTFRATLPLGGANYDTVVGTAPMDLAADQCTLFLVQNRTTIRRFNVCTGTFLPDFATLPDASSVRLLPDGDVLVASANTVVRLDSTGVIARTYTRPAWTHIGPIVLADGGATLWVAEDACEAATADAIDLGVGSLVESHPLDMTNPHSIVPWQAWTAAIGTGGATGAAEIPTASAYALMALAALVAFAAIRRIS